MSVNLTTSSPVFKANNQMSPIKYNHNTCEHCEETITNTKNEETKPKKKGFWNKFKNGFIGIRKAFIDFGYVTAGAIKGAAYGALTGLGVAGGVAIRNIIKKAPKKLGLGGKILAGVAGLTVMGVTVFNSKLNANEAKSKLDHRWETGHNG